MPDAKAMVSDSQGILVPYNDALQNNAILETKNSPASPRIGDKRVHDGSHSGYTPGKRNNLETKKVFKGHDVAVELRSSYTRHLSTIQMRGNQSSTSRCAFCSEEKALTEVREAGLYATWWRGIARPRKLSKKSPKLPKPHVHWSQTILVCRRCRLQYDRDLKNWRGPCAALLDGMQGSDEGSRFLAACVGEIQESMQITLQTLQHLADVHNQDLPDVHALEETLVFLGQTISVVLDYPSSCIVLLAGKDSRAVWFFDEGTKQVHVIYGRSHELTSQSQEADDYAASLQELTTYDNRVRQQTSAVYLVKSPRDYYDDLAPELRERLLLPLIRLIDCPTALQDEQFVDRFLLSFFVVLNILSEWRAFATPTTWGRRTPNYCVVLLRQFLYHNPKTDTLMDVVNAFLFAGTRHASYQKFASVVDGLKKEQEKLQNPNWLTLFNMPQSARDILFPVHHALRRAQGGRGSDDLFALLRKQHLLGTFQVKCAKVHLMA